MLLKKKKCNFLLLEVLISFTLLSLSSILLVRGPLLFFQKELKILSRLEYERIADLSFCDLKSRFLNNSISWEDLADNREKTLPPLDLVILPGQQLHLERKYIIEIKKEAFTKDASYRLLAIHIFLKRAQESKFSKYKFLVRAVELCEKDPSHS